MLTLFVLSWLIKSPISHSTSTGWNRLMSQLTNRSAFTNVELGRGLLQM